jgi:hypothetical protein
MKDLSEAEQRCLIIVQDILSAGRQPSILEVARLMKITKGGANHHMRALRDKGALRGPRVVWQWALTREGKRALEKKS